MITPGLPAPPYALAPLRFPFRALAAQVGRGALGGERECGLACLMAARLASALLPASRLPAPLRLARASAARGWLAALALPAALRIPVARVVDASAGDDTLRLAQNIRVLAIAAAQWLDTPSRAELERLALTLGAEPTGGSPAVTNPSTAT